MTEPLPNPPLTLAQSIARMEGWYVKGVEPNRCQRNNNPGNLNFSRFAVDFGAEIEDHPEPRFAKFPTAQDGWHALEALLRSPAYAELTMAQAIARYAPSTENDTAEYVRSVSAWTQKSPDTRVGDIA